MVYHDTAFRAVMERLNLIPLKRVAQQPGVQTALRFLVYYSDGRAYHSASTLIHESQASDAQLETFYVGLFDGKAIVRQIDNLSFHKLLAVFQQVKFDTLHFPNSDLLHTPTIWCIEKASASFYHQLILNPHHNKPPYCQLINAVDGYLSEAVREILQ